MKRRGVSSVLAMMFLVIFSSLAAAMAVVAQGNLRTADSALKVSRAMSAAETGLGFAARRLALEGRRFVITRGTVDADFAVDLWEGSYVNSEVTVLPPDGYDGELNPNGLLAAMYDAFTFYSDGDFAPEVGDDSLPSIDADAGALYAQPIPLDDVTNPPYFRLSFEILDPEDDIPGVRVTSRGVDGDVVRTLQMDFIIDKKIEYAVISPNRIMIGKNVRVEGPLGSRYGIATDELNNANGDPLVMQSDFYYLHDDLDDDLDTFFAQLVLHDADGDGRLRPDHPAESVAIAAFPAVLVDYDGNEYIDDFDLFLAQFDTNNDNAVTYGGGSPEFEVDDQLARLIDEATPDRNGDDISDAADIALGYKNGVIDANDLYAKVAGRLAFAVAQSSWEAAHGSSYQTIVQGPIRTEQEEAPVAFEVSSQDLLEITTDMLDNSQTWFYSQAQSGGDFGAYDPGTGNWDGQVGSNLSTEASAVYEAPSTSTWESVPYGSIGAYDYYQRPIFRNMTFRNVRIPRGTNALFDNCTFIGVTYVETEVDCDHENWNYAGAVNQVDLGGGTFAYELKFPDLEAESGGAPVTDTRAESNNIRFNGCTFIGTISGDKPNEYTHWRNKLQMTGETRFFIDPTDPDIASQPDAAEILSEINALSDTELTEMLKSSILLPGWSVDVGTFDNDTANGSVNLKGTIVAGILDARGTVDVHGTLMMTFRPTSGAGPLYYGGQPDAFNTTIGYFGPSDGDGEGMDPDDPSFAGFGEITLRYDPDASLPDGIPWPITVDAMPITYSEGGAS